MLVESADLSRHVSTHLAAASVLATHGLEESKAAEIRNVFLVYAQVVQWIKAGHMSAQEVHTALCAMMAERRAFRVVGVGQVQEVSIHG